MAFAADTVNAKTLSPLLVELWGNAQFAVSDSLSHAQNERAEKWLREKLRAVGERKSAREADGDFDALMLLQEPLSVLLFKYQFQMSPCLEGFVRRCDRIDDPRFRELFFEEIKGSTFPLQPSEDK